jgi:hypothetical protein
MTTALSNAADICHNGATREEVHLTSLCRGLIALRLKHEDAKRRRFVSSREDMESDIAVERQRRLILQTLRDILNGPNFEMVSAAKAKMFRSVARGRLRKEDLALPEPPTKTTYNRRTGVATATHQYGSRTYTNVYSPVVKP